MMGELAPVVIQRLAAKVAAAFEDVQNELATAAGSSATRGPGRPRVHLAYEKVLILREAGLSWADIARELGAARTTVRRVYANLRRAAS